MSRPDVSLVSVVIPTHNRSAILRQTLGSLAGVRRPAGVGVEVVVAASACTDDTPAVVASAAAELPFPVRLVVEPRIGVSRARNLLIREARGDVLAILDDDVDVAPEWLAALLDAFATTAADLVGGRITLWWNGVEPPAWLDPALATAAFTARDHGERVVELHRESDVATANLAVRRRVFDRIGGFDEALGHTDTRGNTGEDTDFVRRALRGGFRMFYSPDAAVGHLVSPQRLTPGHLSEIAYTNALYGMWTRDPFPPGRMARAGAGHLYLAVRHGASEAVHRLRGDARGAFRHRLRRTVGVGGLVGVLTRAAGRAKVRPA